MQKKIINIIGVVTLISLFIYSLYKSETNTQELKGENIIIEGTIEGTKIGKSNYFITYSYNYQAKSYFKLKSTFATSFDNVNNFLVGKKFPVILSKENTDNTELLIFRKDFERYGLVYPDSLKWVCDSLKLKDCN